MTALRSIFERTREEGRAALLTELETALGALGASVAQVTASATTRSRSRSTTGNRETGSHGRSSTATSPNPLAQGFKLVVDSILWSTSCLHNGARQWCIGQDTATMAAHFSGKTNTG